MVVGEAINNIMGGIENTGTVKQHNHKKKLRQRFDIIKKLGQGTFGKVQLGINKETGQEVAIKTIKKSKIESDADLIRIRREIQIMSSVQHPNIIHIYEVFENREKMVLVMEYAAGGELYDYLSERKVLDEEEARRIFRQIATACYYCHKHKICHRDLKLENILLDENNNAKIADFGLSNVFDDQRLLNTFCGSPLYASPEIVKGTPYHGPEVDCWSLGVLLYTLVYGAMPFDGSNFKRLVKQISQGDYFEPTKPSPASPLIREMLTVNPKNRADIEKICTHWWVNEGYGDSCLDISEELANQTPVRLDVLLSLAPPAPQLESDKLMVTGDEDAKIEPMAPARSQSVGSLMELAPAERRIIDLIKEDKVTPKRKLETTVSTDRANLDKRKDKIVKENTVADITVRGAVKDVSLEDASMSEAVPLNKSLTQTLSREMDVEQTEVTVDPSLQGAACSEIIEESEKKKQSKLKKTLSTSVSSKVLEGISEIPSQENVASNIDKENIEKTVEVQKPSEKEEKAEAKSVKKKVGKKKVLADKNENVKSEAPAPQPEEKPKEKQAEEKEQEAEAPNKPIERRKSRIFEAAEKFQNMMAPPEAKPMLTDKPKKVIIPGVSVDGYKKEFERKASLTSTSPPRLKGALSKKNSLDKKADEEVETDKESKLETKKTDECEMKERVKNAVNIISSALEKEGTRKSKSRPCVRKPPVPFGVGGRSASGNIATISSPLSPPPGPKPFVKPVFDKPEVKQVFDQPEPPVEESKTSSAEITFKSATLPRKKTKAEIQLNYPIPKPTTMGFKTEMAHNIQAGPTQRSEVVVPVAAAARSNVAESDKLQKRPSKERIIPIAVAKDSDREEVQSPPTKPPTPKAFQTQKSNSSQRNSLSRQSTQESDSETVGSSGEPIKKSPREYIIPIAMEGGGYVTPRAGSLEPSDTASTTSTMTNRSKTRFGGRTRKMGSLFSDRDSEDESSPFSTLHRHGSIGRDSDTEDSKSAFHMHRLRSTRPKRSTLEHNDSVSSGEEDDDEGFEILTAENLFSTLLSRVRDLTQRLNVDDGVRPGFPSSRLLSHFDHGTNFWNRMDHPLSRHSSLGRTMSRDRPVVTNSTTGSSFGVPWRRSVSRDLASDIDSVFKNTNSSGQRPTGDDVSGKENLNLADLDLKKLKLSDEDALALSYLTPGLSRRIQKQLLSQLAPSEVRKLQRTLSSHTSDESVKPSKSIKSLERMSSTLPRRLSLETTNRNSISKEDITKKNELIRPRESNIKSPKSFLPIKNNREEYTPSYEFNIRSASIGSEPRSDNKFSFRRPKITKSLSVREPKGYIPKSDIQSPESSLSESLSSSYRNAADSIDSSSKGFSDSSASRPYSKYSSESSYSRYSPSKSYDSTPSFIPSSSDSNKTDIKKPSSSTRRVSRFLRPDFFEPPKEENIYLKEKKEREMETQKVLKEIRDKRKGRLNLRRERSASREQQPITDQTTNNFNKGKDESVKETENLLSNVSNSIKNLEDNVKNIHDYVNVSAPVQNSNEKTKEATPKTSQNNDYVNTAKVLHDYVNVKAAVENTTPTVKKEKVSRIARPKSYPSDNVGKEKSDIVEKEKLKTSPEKESKITKLRKGFNRSKEKTKEDKNLTNKNINEEDKGHKNKLLQSIEKKLEKFRSTNSTTNKNPEEIKALQDKKSSVESAIRRLREQSLPRNLEHCTESGLIKRAVSVEDMSGSKPLQASRKSVTKILGLFKKYEEQENKQKEKVLKKNKNKENGKKPSDKEGDKCNETVIISNDDIKKVNSKETNSSAKIEVPQTDSSQSDKERPRSLLLDKVKHFQNVYNGAKSDTVLNNDKDKESKVKSKLPVNSFRRSLNLDNLPEPPKFSKNSSKSNMSDNDSERPDRKSLKLDFSQIPSNTKPLVIIDTVETENKAENRNSLTTDDSSTMLSPGEDYLSCDSWSVCSDFHHTNDLTSPVSPNGHIYSGDENESVIDRIRRKSFYTRFNEKKRPRRPSATHNYKDLDLSYRSPTDYCSLDRRTYDYRSPRRSSYTSSIPEPAGKDYKYSRSSSLLNDYVNVPNRYQTYSSKIGRPASCIYSDSEDNTLDDLLSTAKSRKYSPHIQTSRLGRTSVSPVNEYYLDRPSSSVASPTSSEPI